MNMLNDIVVTTPKSEMKAAAAEAQDCICRGGGHYFRRLNSRPTGMDPGSKVFYVEDGYIRGYATLCAVMTKHEIKCATTGRTWPPGVYLIMPAKSWRWIRPLSMTGFQGWRYFKFSNKVEEVGGWLDPKPRIPGRENVEIQRLEI